MSSSPPLTPQQRAALAARDRSVSLAAGAGCGKTFVLTERFLAEIDPAEAAPAAALDELVAMTFTDAAAREMRDRIRRRCFQRLETAPDAASAAVWQRLMRSMDEARISTIHSFCTTLLRRYAVEAQLDPQFEVLDAPAAELLKLDVIDQLLRQRLAEGDDDLLDLAARHGLDRLRGDLAALVGPQHSEALARWREATPQQLVDHWLRRFDELAPGLLAAELASLAPLAELRRWARPELAASDRLAGHLTELAAELEPARLAARPPAESCASLLQLARVQGVCRAPDWRDPIDYEAFRKAAEETRNALKKTSLPRPDDLAKQLDAAALALALVRLADDAAAALAAAKANRNQLEFEDLLVRTAALLADPEQTAARAELSRGTRLVMVDEFQDTNPRQTAIVQALCGDDWQQRGLFAVGDFKQSIYRFTGATPHVSTQLRAALPEASRLSLTTNFRSQPAVLDFVNAVFVHALEDYEPLQAARPQTTPTPAVEFLWSPGPRTLEDPGDSAAAAPGRRRRGATRDARAEEARWIARRLVELIETQAPIIVEQHPDGSAARPLRPGDVAILLRALSDAQVYEEALRDHGLSYYLAGGHAFYAQQEIFDVLNLLRATASEVDEVALAGALRSPLFALADETLFWLVDAHGSLEAALASERTPATLAAADAAKVRRAADVLRQLRAAKDRLLAADVLALALELTGFDATLQAEFLGRRKAANVAKLVEQARTLDRRRPGDLPGFITQLAEFVERAPKEPLAATQAHGSDAVQIMTIHHAKGLEFPLVVVPDLARPRYAGGNGPVLDDDLGPLVPAGSDGGVGYELYRRRESFEDLQERKRLLYVACTRAADYLLLSSSVDDLAQPPGDWLPLVDAAIDLKTGLLRQPLPAGYATPQVRVTTDCPGERGVAEPRPRGADLSRLVAKTRELVARGAPALPREADAVSVDASARRRYSFSRLSGQLTPMPAALEIEDDGTEPAPLSAGASEADPDRGDAEGREFGSLVHAVLQYVDLRGGDAAAWSEYFAPELVSRAPDKTAEEAARLVEQFLASPRGRALAAAVEVRREVEFLLPWPPQPPGSAPAPVDSAAPRRYLHGVIDCLYRDAEGAWHVLDYKTNRIAPGAVSATAAQYELQLLAYRLACEMALGQPPAECTLVMLAPQREHAYSWDSAEAARGVARLTAAMDAVAAELAAAPSRPDARGTQISPDR